MSERDARKCQELFSRLSEYLDGELDAGICSEIDSHLGDCPPCVAFMESLRRTVSLLKGFPAKPMPAGLKQEILDAARKLRRADPE